MRSNPTAPRWAGWTAALFGVEYAVSKIVMATQGELGVVGHPAPREATESFSGSVAVAQLGNAGLGLLVAAVALALVHPWGRRIPSALLAAGAVAALAGGVAGVAVVGASLTGIREDHGQWGVDSLILGVAPLVAWVVLTVAALRAVRIPRLAPAVVAAAAGCLLYGAMKLSWALGTVRAPGRLRSPVLWLARIVGGLMVLRASYGAASDLAVLTGAVDGARRTATWDLLLWSPFFGAWGAVWLVAAGAPQPRSRLRTPSALRGANASQSLLK
jgi:hypothetical protein